MAALNSIYSSIAVYTITPNPIYFQYLKFRQMKVKVKGDERNFYLIIQQIRNKINRLLDLYTCSVLVGSLDK